MAIPQDPQIYSFLHQFLKEMRTLISLGKVVVKKHLKNEEALLSLEITRKDREAYILNLTEKDYYAGPKPDKYWDGYVYWEFLIMVKETEVYVKLEIVEDRNGDFVLCYSFHPSGQY